MAPSAVSEVPILPAPSRHGNNKHGQVSYPEPLKLSGALDHFTFEETTPVIGREFFNIDIVDDLLNDENADERLRDLAITSKSHRYSSFTASLTARQFPNAASSFSARNPK